MNACAVLDDHHSLMIIAELRQLDLQHNSITGTIPPAIGTLTNLLYLNLKDNTHLGGALPVGPLSNLTKLNRLSLVHCSFDLGPNSSAVNSLQGILPRCKIWA